MRDPSLVVGVATWCAAVLVVVVFLVAYVVAGGVEDVRAWWRR